MFQQFKQGQLVIDIITKQTGKVVGKHGHTYAVEIIVSKDKTKKTRTTKVAEISAVRLRPYNPQKHKKKSYAPYFDVMEFHKAFGHPVPEKPKPIKPERAQQRADYLVEELVEFLWASVAGNEKETNVLVDKLIHSVQKAKNKCFKKGEFPKEDILVNQTDALNDINYINYGSIVETGVNPKPVFEIIQKSNLAKLDENGKPIYDPETNKILKPKGWEEKYKPEPLIKKEIERQLEVASRKNSKQFKGE